MKKIFAAIIIIAMVSIAFSGCITQSVENPPHFVVVSDQKRETGEGIDMMHYVDVTVRNDGGTGMQTIRVKATQDSNSWSREDTVEIASGASATFSFNMEANNGIPWTYEVVILEV